MQSLYLSLKIDNDGTVVWESHAILRYLAARYGDSNFWSDDARIRSQADRWMDWAQTSPQPEFLMGIFWGFYRTPEPKRNWAAIHESINRVNKYFLLLNNILKDQPYLGGENLTLADIPAGAMLYRYFELEIERPVISRVEEWYKRLQSRLAYRENVMIPFADLKGRLSY